MIVTLKEIKEWLRIDGDYDDSLLTLIMTIAQEKIEEYGEHALSSQKAKLLFLILVTDMYENRTTGISPETEKSILGLKNELRFGGDASGSS